MANSDLVNSALLDYNMNVYVTISILKLICVTIKNPQNSIITEILRL